MAETDALLSMHGIDKGFPGVQALQGVDFTLREGEIHAIVGENGAGKSTLIKILTGVERPDAGTITLAGQDITVRSPHHAQALGHQHGLPGDQPLPEPVGRREHPHRPSTATLRDASTPGPCTDGPTRSCAGSTSTSMSPSPSASYSVAIQQMAAIARALEISSRGS